MNNGYDSDKDDVKLIATLVMVVAIVFLLYIVLKIVLGIVAFVGVLLVICLMFLAAYAGHKLALGERLNISRPGNKHDRKIARVRFLEEQKEFHLAGESDPQMQQVISDYFDHLRYKVFEDANLFDEIVNKLKNVKGLFQ
jgi:hypothetical protein